LLISWVVTSMLINAKCLFVLVEFVPNIDAVCENRRENVNNDKNINENCEQSMKRDRGQGYRISTPFSVLSLDLKIQQLKLEC